MSGSNSSDADRLLTMSNGEQDGSLLWIRDWKLSVGTGEGSHGLDLSQLAFSFNISEGSGQPIRQATFTIYNVLREQVQQMSKEFTVIHFEGGYRKPSAQYGRLFTGPITYFRYGRQSATDTFVEIHAMQQDPTLNQAVINTTLPAGHTQQDIVQAIGAVLAPYGVGIGQITNMGDAQSPRGRVLYGNVTDVLRDLAQTHNANYHIDRDNNLHILKEGEPLQSAASNAVPVLNSKTGMIGIPTSTLGGGVEIRSLLNPAIIPNGAIQINENDVVTYTAVDTSQIPDTDKQIELSNKSLSADGRYLVGQIKHYGENRGNAWYTDIITQALDPSAPGGAAPSIPR